jgi:hypothetical protein
MFHLAAYSLATNTNAGNVDTPAVTDSVLTISNNHFRLVDNMSLVGAAVASPTIVRARLDSPTLRIPGNPYVIPVNAAAQFVDRQKLMDWSQTPYQLPTREEIALQTTISAAGPEVTNGFIWLSLGGLNNIPPGKPQWIYLTSTTAAVANTWTTLQMTFQTSLPTGYWAVTGSVHQSATALAHRFFFPGQIYRPGFLSHTTEGFKAWRWNYNGALGEMGRFVNDNPPQINVYCTAADAAHNIYLQLVQVGSL